MFPGGVPGWIIFGTQLQDIRKLLSTPEFADPDDAIDRTLGEISIIGLIAHFEGMVRYHFASLINICPHLLTRYSRNMTDMAISLRDIALLETLHGTIGYLIADAAGFSSPKEINKQYNALLGITPFGKRDATRYDAVLKDRHQLVHSAGICTLKYLRTLTVPPKPSRDRAYMDSVEASRGTALNIASFLQSMTEKLVKTTYAELCKVENWHSPAEFREMAEHIEFLKWSDAAFEPDYEPTEY